MSDETYSLFAFLSVLVAMVAVWSSFRRAQITRRLLKSLDRNQLREIGYAMRREPPTVASAMAIVIKELEAAQRSLDENNLPDAEWAVSGALRALTDLREHRPDGPASLHTLEDELRDFDPNLVSALLEKARALAPK
ncbi:MAG TPA: hypothetical protein VF787_17065 [Thermoanaerobaculia bacterium]